MLRIMTADQNVPIGLAMPLADDVEGRAVNRLEHRGRFAPDEVAVGAMPSEPASAAARSDSTSACKLVATRYRWFRLHDLRMVIASTASCPSHVLNRRDLDGNLIHITMAWRWRWTWSRTVSSLRRPGLRELKAKRMMRSTPARSGSIRSGLRLRGQALVDAGADAGIFAFEFFADDDPVSSLP